MLCYKKDDELIIAEIKPRNSNSTIKIERLLNDYFPVKDVTDEYKLDEKIFSFDCSTHYNRQSIYNPEKEFNGEYLEDHLYDLMGINGIYQQGNTEFKQTKKSYSIGNFIVNNYGVRTLGYNFSDKKMALLSEHKFFGGYKLTEYKMIYPAISLLFAQGYRDNNRMPEISEKLFNYGCFDMANLIDGGIDSLKQLKEILKNDDKEALKNDLNKDFPKFSHFYYNICSSIKFSPLKSYSLKQLKDLKKEILELDLEPTIFNRLIDLDPLAENNTEVLKVINKIKY